MADQFGEEVSCLFVCLFVCLLSVVWLEHRDLSDATEPLLPGNDLCERNVSVYCPASSSCVAAVCCSSAQARVAAAVSAAASAAGS